MTGNEHEPLESALDAIFERQEWCDCGHRSGQHREWQGQCDLCGCQRFERAHLGRNPAHFHQCSGCGVDMACVCPDRARRDLRCLECGGESDFNRKRVMEPTP